MKRVMFAGERSGCGKTTVTCAFIQAVTERGHRVSAFKCGPDYIDPMFHKTALGADSYNLDSFLMSGDTINYLLAKNSGDINVIEGVMGFYDGMGFTGKGSSRELSEITDTPVILIVDCGGRSLSAAAAVKGFKEFKENKIAGVIFNNLKDSLYADMARGCRTVGVEPLGYMPRVRGAEIESRHLGLVTAAEIGDIKNKIRILGEQAEKTIDIDRVLETAERGDTKTNFSPPQKTADVKIAVARDKAFCFYYADNLNLLKSLGARLLFFSPLANESVPDCDGIIIGGGYPELYADVLAKNTGTLKSLRAKILGGAPCIAECGGFMYLHESITVGGEKHNMVGVIEGTCRKTDRLQRFGYMEMTAKRDNILCKRGHKIRSREFHYFDSTNPGRGFTAQKNGRSWECVHAEGNLFAGFPHLHFYSDVTLAENFIKSCEEYKCKR